MVMHKLGLRYRGLHLALERRANGTLAISLIHADQPRMNTHTWDRLITPERRIFELDIQEIWSYRDLISQLVRRDVVVLYKQTVLGPLWYIIQPLMLAGVFTIMFNNIADIGTGGVPPFLFNSAGLLAWEFFRDGFTSTADTFKINSAVFSKVYFPRAVLPIATVISRIPKFGVQFALFVGFYIYYKVTGSDFSTGWQALGFPAVLVLLMATSIGAGMLVSAMVTKYRDLVFVLQFGVQLLMYLSAVPYPLSLIDDKLPSLAFFVRLNPLTHIVEMCRWALVGRGTVSIGSALYAVVSSVVVLLVGLALFNRASRNSMDTV